MTAASKNGVLAVCGTLLCLSIGAVALRFIARKQQRLAIKADDILAVFALVTYLGTAATVFAMVHLKFVGYAYRDIPMAYVRSIAKTAEFLDMAYSVMLNFTLALTKTSAVLYYRRHFCVEGWSRFFDVASLVTIPLVVLWAVLFTVVGFFECSRFSAFWDGTQVKYCHMAFPLQMGLVISDLLLDIWILLLPVPSIAKLHVSLTKRLSIIGVFLLAYVGLGASIGRNAIYIAAMRGGIQYTASHDEGVTNTKIFFFSVLEAGMSVFAINLPTLWVLRPKFNPNKISGRLHRALPSSLVPGVSQKGPKAAPITTRKVKTVTVKANATEPWEDLHLPMPQSSEEMVQAYGSTNIIATEKS